MDLSTITISRAAGSALWTVEVNGKPEGSFTDRADAAAHALDEVRRAGGRAIVDYHDDNGMLARRARLLDAGHAVEARDVRPGLTIQGLHRDGIGDVTPTRKISSPDLVTLHVTRRELVDGDRVRFVDDARQLRTVPLAPSALVYVAAPEAKGTA
ncbi:hypothetical protein [Amycolatopsis sp. NPDC058986]|uniref:hypothetical protein n=1 Tax=unclassified Amycolatopsis TaxID=2618356 RepID=UPI00366B3AE1